MLIFKTDFLYSYLLTQSLSHHCFRTVTSCIFIEDYNMGPATEIVLASALFYYPFIYCVVSFTVNIVELSLSSSYLNTKFASSH